MLLTELQHGMSAHDLALVKSIVATWLPTREVRMFGSRARGTPKPYSDLDLVIMGDAPTPLTMLGQLQEAFANSDLPWRVDVVDWASTSPEFQRHIQASCLPLPCP
jgi:predicted nucleotidyltransferase